MYQITQRDKLQSQIGLATFKPYLPIPLKIALNRYKIVSVLESDDWTICDQKFFRYSWNQLFLWITEAECKHLHIEQAGYPEVSVPRQIHTEIFIPLTIPSFPKLQVLILGFNGIQSIESLPFLNMEDLKELNLSNNLITNLKPAQKCKWKKHLQVCLFENPIKEITLERMKTNESENKKSQIKLGSKNIEFYSIYDINFMAKLNMSQMRLNFPPNHKLVPNSPNWLKQIG